MNTDFGPSLKLATRAELVEELCSRRDLPALVFYQTDRNDNGEVNYMTRHSFEDKATLARSLRLLADTIENGPGETTVTYPLYRRE